MLSEYVARVVATGAQLRIGLALGPDELTDPGYSRTQPSKWDADAGSLAAQAQFGPFHAPVEFDTVMLYDRSGFVEARPLLGGTVRLTPGMTHQQRVTLTFTHPEAPHV